MKKNISYQIYKTVTPQYIKTILTVFVLLIGAFTSQAQAAFGGNARAKQRQQAGFNAKMHAKAAPNAPRKQPVARPIKRTQQKAHQQPAQAEKLRPRGARAAGKEPLRHNNKQNAAQTARQAAQNRRDQAQRKAEEIQKQRLEAQRKRQAEQKQRAQAKQRQHHEAEQKRAAAKQAEQKKREEAQQKAQNIQKQRQEAQRKQQEAAQRQHHDAEQKRAAAKQAEQKKREEARQKAQNIQKQRQEAQRKRQEAAQRQHHEAEQKRAVEQKRLDEIKKQREARQAQKQPRQGAAAAGKAPAAAANPKGKAPAAAANPKGKAPAAAANPKGKAPAAAANPKGKAPAAAANPKGKEPATAGMHLPFANLSIQKTCNNTGAGLSVQLSNEHQAAAYDDAQLEQMLSDILQNPGLIAQKNNAYAERADQVINQLGRYFTEFKNYETVMKTYGPIFEQKKYNALILKLNNAVNGFTRIVKLLERTKQITANNELINLVENEIKKFETLLAKYIGSNIAYDHYGVENMADIVQNFYDNLQDLVFENIKIIIEPHEQEQWAQRAIKDNNPIWALQECDDCDPDFSRDTNRRKDFITQQAQNYALQNIRENKTLNYTSIGSGDLLFDLFILTNLVNEGYDTINVRFIDLEYEEFFNNYTNPNQDDYDTMMRQYQFVQFLEWFNIYLSALLNRDIHVNLILYPNRDSYEKDYNRNPNQLKNDLVLAIDISLYHETKGNVGDDVTFLINETLRENGKAFLFKDDPDVIVEKQMNGRFSIQRFQPVEPLTNKQKLVKLIDPYKPAAPIRFLGRRVVNMFKIADLRRAY